MRIVANRTKNANKPKNKGMKVCARAAASLVTVIAVGCFVARLIPEISTHSETAALTAAGFIMPQGGAEIIKTGFGGADEEEGELIDVSSSVSPVSSQPSSQTSQSGESSVSGTSSQSTSSAPAPSGPGKAYPIKEVQLADNGIQYQGIYVKNNTEKHSVNIAEELKKQPAVKIKTNGTPQVLIYHTHTTECYMSNPAQFFYSTFPTRTLNTTQNVVMVGNAIEAELKAAGIGVIHDTTLHDYPSYNGSYYRSEDTMKKILKQYPGIQVTLDVHRDAMGATDGSRIKPTVMVNGKRAAQVMIVSGCDDDGTQEFPDWEYNLRFALRLQQSSVQLYPGLARPIDFCNAQYNENRTKGSLLVEFGTEVNTVEEVSYSGSLFGKALVKTLLALK